MNSWFDLIMGDIGDFVGFGSARRQRAFNANEAQKQRDWQTMMSNTAHQREIADLQAAGLNPVLSGTGGQGASTPSGGVATSAIAQPHLAETISATSNLIKTIKGSNNNNSNDINSAIKVISTLAGLL